MRHQPTNKMIESTIVLRELKARGVRFLPRQALRPAFRQQTIFESSWKGLRRLTDDELEHGIQIDDLAS